MYGIICCLSITKEVCAITDACRAAEAPDPLLDAVCYYEIAGITVRVESDLPIDETTFDPKFADFRAEGPGVDTVRLAHHFGLPGVDVDGLGEPLYHQAPWAVYRRDGSWVYLGIAPEEEDPSLHRVAVFSADHACGDIYNDAVREQVWRDGGLTSLTMFPTDQILLARLLADREGCLLHSGGLIIDGRGLLFVGHSEAGKSTTMRLVKDRLGDRAEILCDDRNAVRRWPEGFRVHGTWSHGDVPDVSAASAPLHAVLFLEQADRNALIPWDDRKETWQRLLETLIRPVATGDWWQKELDVLGRLMDEVPCYIMRFDTSGAIVDDLERLIG